ncbi:EF hand [Dictyocaulus viviparus]|uniref:EF hand n=1 Tax=Dictyocaulus viviparus TaxID=29172 RepID=A0A0D8XCS9_DICVI|nr:EF hand [Dictyocaulus viviparus]
MIKTSRIELLLTTIYHNLNKRLVSSQHIDTDKSISLLLSFLLGTYDKQHTGRLSVFSIKIALATICAGKLVDKLRYMFSQISDVSGFLEYDRFTDFLQQVIGRNCSLNYSAQYCTSLSTSYRYSH